MELLNDDTFNHGADYSKLLIFICGNIDEAYSMSGMSSEADIDADTLHGFSKKITVVTVKQALM